MQSNNPSKKMRVGVFFGGKSAEHEVSLQSAKNVLEAMNLDVFDPVLIGIDKSGSWHVKEMPKQLTKGHLTELSVVKNSASLSLLPGTGNIISTDSNQIIQSIDVAFPILHGPMGEDGSIQGFLELANIPYVGPGILGSAVGMDKDIMKRLLRDAGIPITPFRAFTSVGRKDIRAEEIFEELGVPVFVKPANMGSSVGVHKAATESELQNAITAAFKYDSKILIEKSIVGDEIECAILGNEHPEASAVGRIIPREGDFYSYDAKYIDESGAILEIPANLSKEMTDKARAIALETFQVLGCEGMGRVDMFITKSGEVIVNEINTIPGFTKISMYPKLWEESGISYGELITRLVNLAVERHERKSNFRSVVRDF